MERVDGRWAPTSSEQLLRRAQDVACAIRDAGLAAGDRVALVSHNCVDWIVGRFCGALRRLRGRADLSDAGPRSHRLHLAALRRAADLRRRRAHGRPSPRERRGAAADRALRFRRSGRTRSVRGARTRDPRGPSGASRRVRGDAAPRRPRRAHLYLRHDGTAERRDALARQPGVRRPRVADVRLRGHRRRPRRDLGVAVLAHLRAHGHLHLLARERALLHLPRPERAAGAICATFVRPR